MSGEEGELRQRGRSRHRPPEGTAKNHEGSLPPDASQGVQDVKGTPGQERRHLTPVRRASSCSSPARDDLTRRRKIHAIENAVNSKPPDVTTLKQLAISRGGLLNDEMRKKAWPALLDVDVTQIPEKPDQETLHSHRDYQQVVLDVNRSLKRFPPGMDEDIRLGYQDQLVDCIMRVLVHQPDLHYYQGYHDIVVTFLLVVGEDFTFALMDKLSQNHLNDFMDVNMDKTNHILNYLYPIVGKASPKLQEFMENCEVGTIFCLSWLITWYGHVLSDFRHIVRLYDFFIACHPIMPIYLAAATVLYREKEVLACEPEMPFVHSLLAKMPDDLPFELLCSKAGDLFIQYPPEVMAEEARLHYEKTQLANEMKLISQQAAREKLAKRRAANAYNSTIQGRLWNKARSLALNRHGVLYHVTIWTLVAAFTAAAYTLYMGTGDGSSSILGGGGR